MGRSSTHRQPGPSTSGEVLIVPTTGPVGGVAAERRRHTLRRPDRGLALNALQHGARCVVTTRDRRIISGWYRGIEVTHGDRSILIETAGSTHSVPVASVLRASNPDRRVS